MSASASGGAGDYAAIAALIHRYAQFVRHGRGAACGALFIENAVYEIYEADGGSANAAPRLRSRLEGRGSIQDYIAGSTGRGIRLCPLIHNLIIEIAGDRATANSVMEGHSWPAGNETIGEYEDCVMREGGQWRFASRRFTMFVNAGHVHGR